MVHTRAPLSLAPLRWAPLWALFASAAALPAAAGSDDVITMRGSRVEVAALPSGSGIDALRGTRRGGPPDLGEGTLRVGQSGRNALRAQMRAMRRTLEEHLGLAVPPSTLDELPLFGDAQALRGKPGPGVSRQTFERRELASARLGAARSLLRGALPGAPAWLEAGFAQYFEGIEVAGGATAVYAQPAQDAALRLALAQQRLLPLQDVLTRSANGFDASVDGVLASAQAWALVFYLMEQGESHEVMRGVVGELARDPESSVRSVVRPFSTLALLERDWRRFLGQSRRTHLLFLTDELRREIDEEPVVVVDRDVLVYPGFYGSGFYRSAFYRPGFYGSRFYRSDRPFFNKYGAGFKKSGFKKKGFRKRGRSRSIGYTSPSRGQAGFGISAPRGSRMKMKTKFRRRR